MACLGLIRNNTGVTEIYSFYGSTLYNDKDFEYHYIILTLNVNMHLIYMKI